MQYIFLIGINSMERLLSPIYTTLQMIKVIGAVSKESLLQQCIWLRAWGYLNLTMFKQSINNI